MGCHGMLNGLRVAGAFLEQDPGACVLLVALEMCSLHHQYGWDAGQIVANALFADGAAAVVGIGGEPRSASDLRVVASGSQVIDDSEDAMSWRIGDNGFVMTLSQRIPELIARNIRAYLDGWLSEFGLDLGRVGSWAVHPGGPRILSAFSEATRLIAHRLKVSHEILAEYGNMSSPTVFFIINRMRQMGSARPIVAPGFRPRPGSRVGATGMKCRRSLRERVFYRKANDDEAMLTPKACRRGVLSFPTGFTTRRLSRSAEPAGGFPLARSFAADAFVVRVFRSR